MRDNPAPARPIYDTSLGEMIWMTLLIFLLSWGALSMQLLGSQFITLIEAIVAMGAPETFAPFMFLIIASAIPRLLAGPAPRGRITFFLSWAGTVTTRLGSGGLILLGALSMGIALAGIAVGGKFGPLVLLLLPVFWGLCALLGLGSEPAIRWMLRQSRQEQFLLALVMMGLLPPVVTAMLG